MATDFPRSYLRTLIAEDDARRDSHAARYVAPLEVTVASVTGIDEHRARREPAEDITWRTHAACLDIDPGLFFPGPHENSVATQAREVCAGCPVQRECLEFALTHVERFGIWGGTSERERRRLRRTRRSGAA